MPEDPEIEYHPFDPFVLPDAKVLILGTFPPQPKRWSMTFYYPNRTNDFWYMMGLIFYNDKHALWDCEAKRFKLEKIKQLLTEKKIALSDTGYAVRRLKNNASDKYLEIVEPVPLKSRLEKMPQCHTLATTGEKAASVIAELTSTDQPKMGTYVKSESGLEIWRMPSTSRAYPLRLELKADYYRKMFIHIGIL